MHFGLMHFTHYCVIISETMCASSRNKPSHLTALFAISIQGQLLLEKNIFCSTNILNKIVKMWCSFKFVPGFGLMLILMTVSHRS